MINQISNLCTKALYVFHVLFGCRCVQNILNLPSYSFVYSNKRKGNRYRDFFPGIGLYCQQLQGHDAEFKKCFTLGNITIYSSSFVNKSQLKFDTEHQKWPPFQEIFLNLTLFISSQFSLAPNSEKIVTSQEFSVTRLLPIHETLCNIWSQHWPSM